MSTTTIDLIIGLLLLGFLLLPVLTFLVSGWPAKRREVLNSISEIGVRTYLKQFFPNEYPEGGNLEALANAFKADRTERLSWHAFTKGSQGSYWGSARKSAEKLLAWASARGLADREPEKPSRVYLTQNGIAELTPFWPGNGPDSAAE